MSDTEDEKKRNQKQMMMANRYMSQAFLSYEKYLPTYSALSISIQKITLSRTREYGIIFAVYTKCDLGNNRIIMN